MAVTGSREAHWWPLHWYQGGKTRPTVRTRLERMALCSSRQSRGDQDVVILSGGVKKEGEESGVTHRVLTCTAE